MTHRNSLFSVISKVFTGGLIAGFLLQGTPWALAVTPAPENHPYGLRPVAANVQHATAAYQDWFTQEVSGDGALGFRRVLWDDRSHTVSEGIGYGMLLAASFSDQALFDDLYGYYQKFPDGSGLMNWMITSAGTVEGANAATDADEDVAFSLLQADYRWGSNGRTNYLAAARALIAKIRQTMVEGGTYVLKPGDVWGGSDVTNPSYFAPAYYRAFAQATGDASWLQVVDKCYAMLAGNADAQTGLVSDWCTGTGAPNSRGLNYSYDACRTPWRIAMDYMFNGEPRALAFCQKLSTWAAGKGQNNLYSGFTQAGVPTVNYLDSAFAGPFACAAAAGGTSAFDEAMYIRHQQIVPTNYYNRSLKALTLALLNGVFPYPNGGLTPPVPTPTPTPTTTPTPTPTPVPPVNGGGSTASPAVLTVRNDWGAGFTGEVTLTNTTPAAWNGWTVSFDLPYRPSDAWNGILVSVTGQTVMLKNAAWNAFVPSGGTVTFGFNATPGNVNTQPTNVRVNGVLLTGGGSVPTPTPTPEPTPVPDPTPTPPPPTPTPPPPVPATGSVNVTYRTVSDWGAGFTGEITVVNNTSQALSNWTLECDFAPRITNIWSAVVSSHTGTHYLFKNESYNGALAPGVKATFGFQGDPGNPAPPANAKVNGVSVTVTKP